MKKLLLMILALTVFAGGASAEEKCALCGMKVEESKRQYFIITTKDSKKQKACNQGCAITLMENIENQIKSIEAVDYNTGKLVEAKSAFYVKGSSIKPVMGGESVVAFEKKEDAEKFWKKNGGKLRTYDELFAVGEQEHKGHKH